MRRVSPTASFVAAGWITVALVLTIGIRQAAVLADAPLRWADSWQAPFLFAGIWAAITVPMLTVARRFPLTRLSRIRPTLTALAVRAVLTGGAVLVQLNVYYLGITALDWPTGNTAIWRDGGGWFLLGRYYEDLAIAVAILAIDASVQRLRVDQLREIDNARRDGLLAEAQLAALGMELQPHFLFNTLNAISTLVHVDPATADRMLARLSTLLRSTLQAGQQPTASVQEEFEVLGIYLSIQQLRFGPRLTIHSVVAEDAEDGVLPRFMLQPIVENALQHGLAPKRGPINLWLSARRAGDTLECDVTDDGVGVPSDGPTREGTGLGNTRARLQALFPGEHLLRIAPAQNGGTIVSIRVPFQTAVTTPTAWRAASARTDR